MIVISQTNASDCWSTSVMNINSVFLQAKIKGIGQPLVGAGDLADQVLDSMDPDAHQIKPENLARCVNRFRQKLHPSHPKTLNFQVCLNSSELY